MKIWLYIALALKQLTLYACAQSNILDLALGDAGLFDKAVFDKQVFAPPLWVAIADLQAVLEYARLSISGELVRVA